MGGDAALAAEFENGHFATIYLSPKDYHRIHMPCDGTLTRMIHVPGDLFSVNPVTARGVPGLFARNERVVCVFDSPVVGPFVLTLVGATIVGSMATVWHGDVTPRKYRDVTALPVTDVLAPNTLAKGAEMARFNMGSTVILLLPPGACEWRSTFQAGRTVRMGERIGTLRGWHSRPEISGE